MINTIYSIRRVLSYKFYNKLTPLIAQIMILLLAYTASRF